MYSYTVVEGDPCWDYLKVAFAVIEAHIPFPASTATRIVVDAVPFSATVTVLVAGDRVAGRTVTP